MTVPSADLYQYRSRGMKKTVPPLSLSLSREGRTRLPDENTQHCNRDIKIMKQIPREIGDAGAGTMHASIELYATSLHRFRIDI